MSELPNGWMMNDLGGIIELVGGGTPKTSIPKYWNGDIPWLSVVDFNNDNRWVLDTEKSITEDGLNNSSTKLLDKGDLIISARGTVGALAQLKNTMAFNQSCYGIKEKNNISDVNFLYYLIKYSLIKISRNVHGAVFDTITRKTFDNIFISLPPLPEQKSIANILSSFDEKIELLREQNETLETLAQTIFKEWFVNFNYPGATGEMVDSVFGEIPKGWRVGKLKDLGQIICGKTPSKSRVEYFNGNIPFIKIPDMHNQMFIIETSDTLTHEGKTSQKLKTIPKDSISVSCIATVGLVSISTNDSQTNQHNSST